jgi:nitrate reductase gamma subunit
MRTISTTLPLSTANKTTAIFVTTTGLSTTMKTIIQPSVFYVGAIVGIIVGSLIVLGIIILIIRSIRRPRMNFLTKSSDSMTQLISVSETSQQYKLTTRAAAQATSTVQNMTNRDSTGLLTTVHSNLAAIEC